MKVQWTSKALNDLVRLYEFLAISNADAAASVIQSLTGASGRLSQHPRLGEKLGEFEPGEVRRLNVGRYEMRYEVRTEEVRVLRIWHSREAR